MPFPQQDGSPPDLLRAQTAVGQVGIPHQHVFQRDAALVAGPASQMLVGKEEELGAARQRPLHDVRRIGRGAHDAAVAAAERLEIGRGIDVRDRRIDLGLIAVEHLAQFPPGARHLGEIGHVGHGTAGGQIRQDRHLLGLRQDVRDLGHEMHAAEDDVARGSLCGEPGELERIAGEIGVPIDVGALIVVAQDHRLLAQLRARREDALLRLLVAHCPIGCERQGFLENRRHLHLLLFIPAPTAGHETSSHPPCRDARRRLWRLRSLPVRCSTK